MKSLLPSPRSSAILFVIWLVLQNSLHPSHLALAALLAMVIPWSLRALAPEGPAPGRPILIARLLAVLASDILVANFDTARRILGRESALRPGFVRVPLALEHPSAVAVLAGCVTLTPGTVSVDVMDGHLLVHALHVTDAELLVAQIKERYEAPLLEIFR